MKIATYNIWNSENGMPHRVKYIVKEIKKINADVICLQEVCNKTLAESITAEAGYQHYYFGSCRDSEEGLCIMSNLPLLECESWLSDVNAIGCWFSYCDKKILIVNIHLPWDSAAERERQIVTIVRNIEKHQYHYAFLAGDFNCGISSDVQRFLNGDCLLNNYESNPRWFDLALSYAESKSEEPECTLNFRKNPRFKNNTIETNSRVDRILLRNTYPIEFPTLNKCSIFGQTIYDDINLSASDHYGVVVEIE